MSDINLVSIHSASTELEDLSTYNSVIESSVYNNHFLSLYLRTLLNEDEINVAHCLKVVDQLVSNSGEVLSLCMDACDSIHHASECLHSDNLYVPFDEEVPF